MRPASPSWPTRAMTEDRGPTPPLWPTGPVASRLTGSGRHPSSGENSMRCPSGSFGLRATRVVGHQDGHPRLAPLRRRDPGRPQTRFPLPQAAPLAGSRVAAASARPPGGEMRPQQQSFLSMRWCVSSPRTDGHAADRTRQSGLAPSGGYPGSPRPTQARCRRRRKEPPPRSLRHRTLDIGL
jgi:hypothetical protein